MARIDYAEAGFFYSMVPKSKFVQMKNDQIDFEPFEKCIKCYRKWHRVCALFNKKVFKTRSYLFDFLVRSVICATVVFVPKLLTRGF